MESFRGLGRWSAGVVLLGLLVVVGCGGDDDDTVAPPANRSPVVNSVTVAPTTVAAGAVATVSVAASDPDGDALTYAYTVTGGGIVGNGATATWTAPSAAGAHTVTVTVSDGKGGTAQGTGVLTVQAALTGIRGTINAPPGPAVDLRNMLVRLFANENDFWNDVVLRSTAAVGNEFSVTFQIVDIAPGNYWVDGWKDADANGLYSAGDIQMFHGTGAWPTPTLAPVMVTQGNVTDCTSGLVVFIRN